MNRSFLTAGTLALVIASALLLPASAQTVGGQKWALLIGIDTYQDKNRINSLDSASEDAREIKKALVDVDGFPEDNVTLLVSDADANAAGQEAKPERNVILRELASLARKVQPGDTVFVLFSGHGIEKNGRSYLLPYDADAFDDGTIIDTAIDTTRFRDRLQAVHAGLLILAFDMCRNNPFKEGREAIGSANTLKTSQVRELDFAAATVAGGTAPATGAASGPRAVVTLFSCSPQERSYEWVDKKRGYFSYFLEQGLRGAKGAVDSGGALRVSTLTHYLTESVSAAVKQQTGGSQTPLVEVRGQIEASRIALATPGVPLVTPVGGEDIVAPKVLATDRHAYLKVALTPVEATLRIDGVVQVPIAGRVAIDLGDESTKVVEIGVEAKGFQSRVQQVKLTRGTIAPFAVALQKADSQEAPPPAPAGSTSASLPHPIDPKAPDAEQRFTDALKTYPKDTSLAIAAADYYANIRKDTGDAERVLYGALDRVDPAAATPVVVRLAFLKKETLKDFTTAESLFRRALKSDPTNFLATVGLADLQYPDRPTGKDPVEAEALYRKAIQLAQDQKLPPSSLVWPLDNLGYLKFAWWGGTPDYAEAERVWKQEIQVLPTSYWGYVGLGRIGIRRKQWDVAEGYLRKAMECDPNGPNAYCDLGIVYRDGRSNFAEAERLIRKAIAISPNDGLFTSELNKTREARKAAGK